MKYKIYINGAEIKAGFDPGQPRNEDGEWTDQGANLADWRKAKPGEISETTSKENVLRQIMKQDFETAVIYNGDGGIDKMVEDLKKEFPVKEPIKETEKKDE